MAPVYKIAVIQLHPKPMRIEANYAKAVQFIKDAASRGAQLAVLPEYHLTNWVPEDPEFEDLCGQWEIYLVKYRTLAKEWTLSDCSEYGLSVNPQSEALFLESTITARTFENTCAVIFVNAGGAAGSSKSNYAGLSRVAVPFAGALGEETKDSREEGMSIVDLDMRHVEEAEANYKVREDLAREDWYYMYRHGKKTEREKL
ncbi:MAG: hypothetical protein Q9222_007094 [Ikaeria aurantiellina]